MIMIKDVLERKTLERQKGGGYDEESRQQMQRLVVDRMTQLMSDEGLRKAV